MKSMCSSSFNLIRRSWSSQLHRNISYHHKFSTSSNFRFLSSFSSEQSKDKKPDDAFKTGQEPTVEESSAKEKALIEENQKLTERVTELDDNFKRALAEGENSRMRMRRQIEEVKVFGIQKFCKDLLEVADVLEKALETAEKDKNMNTMLEGVRLTEQQLQTVFRRHGLTKVNPIGARFDPHEHHAMFETVLDGKEPGTVLEVIKLGYKLKDRVVRPAMVGVVKAKE